MFAKLNWQEIKRIIKFGITGAANTLVDYLVFTILTVWLGFQPYSAQVCSYSAGTLNSYLLNRSWTFKSKERFFSVQMVKFLAANLLVMGISVLSLKCLIEWMGLPVLLAKLFNTGVTLVLNFLLSRLWVFKGTMTDE